MQIIDSGPSVGKEAVKVFEAALDIRLPKDYRGYLLQHNGGCPEPASFTTLDGEESSRVDELYRLNGQEGINDLLSKVRTFVDRMPTDLIAIGCDPFGNQICLAVSGSNYGKVYFWDHELEAEEGEEPGWDNIKLIANSFSEFLNGLYELQDE